MRKVILALSVLFVCACSTSPSHVGSVNKDKSGDEFSIKENGFSFVVAGHYSEYQFVRNSQDGFIGCTNLLNKAAKEYASNNELTINYPTWNEVTVIDHGRDILTAVMNVNCQFEYKDINQIVTDLDITGELKDLSALYEKGLLTESEFKQAKFKLLGK